MGFSMLKFNGRDILKKKPLGNHLIMLAIMKSIRLKSRDSSNSINCKTENSNRKNWNI